MPLVMELLLPHPNEQDVNAVKECDGRALELGAELAKHAPTTVVVLQGRPFGQADAFTPSTADPLALNVLSLDKTTSAGFVFESDPSFVEDLTTHARPAGWAIKKLPQIEFDPSTVAALATVGLTESQSKLVVASLPYRAPQELVDLGLLIGGLAKHSKDNVAVVAVANLSSRLSGPNTKPEAAAFDAAVQEGAQRGDLRSVLSYDLASLEQSGEEASRPIAVLHGAAQAGSPALKPTLRCYTAPSATGYAIITWS